MIQFSIQTKYNRYGEFKFFSIVPYTMQDQSQIANLAIKTEIINK